MYEHNSAPKHSHYYVIACGLSTYIMSFFGTTNSSPIFRRSHSSFLVLIFRGFSVRWFRWSFFSFCSNREKSVRNDAWRCLIQYDVVCLVWMNICLSLCACVSLSWYPWCPAASSPSIGQRSRRGQYKTSGPPFHHPYGESITNVIITSWYHLIRSTNEKCLLSIWEVGVTYEYNSEEFLLCCFGSIRSKLTQ